jgi:hypothetical protein
MLALVRRDLVLLLDIDGVLHPWHREPRLLYGKRRACARRIQQTLKAVIAIDKVLSLMDRIAFALQR